MPEDPYFGPQHVPDSSEEYYVGWVDLMGVGDAMTRSYKSAATNIGKLYSAINNHRHSDRIEVYPMADGMYILGDEDEDVNYVATIMSNIFRQFGNLTYHRATDPGDNYGPWLGFLLRGGIAYGEVYHGSDVDEEEESDLNGVSWMDNVPFGAAIAYAHHEERGIAPYGIGVHESAKSSDDEWKWWNSYSDDTKSNVVKYIEIHFKWCLDNIDNLLYGKERLYVHKERAENYFELPSGYFDI